MTCVPKHGLTPSLWLKNTHPREVVTPLQTPLEAFLELLQLTVQHLMRCVHLLLAVDCAIL